MANALTGSTGVPEVQGLFKKLYGGLEDLRPASAILQRRIDFNGRKRVGESYNVAVCLSPPNGFTYAGSSGEVKQLKAARNAVIRQATLTPYEMDLREQIAFTVLSRAADEGEGAFKDATSEVMQAMMTSASNRVEGSMLHGQRGYGTVDTSGVTDLGGNLATVQITAGTWAPGLWYAYGENSTWDAFTSTTKNNGSGALILKGVDGDTRKLTFQYSGTVASEVTDGDILYPEGAYDGTTHADMPGLLGQASNTSGLSLGLSAATYTNWKGNTSAVSGPLSHGVLEKGIARLRDRGCKARLTAYVANKRYSELALELSALRILDNSYKPTNEEQGIESFAYRSPDVGRVEVVNHPFMKEGEVLIQPDGNCERVGSSDVTNRLPGAGEDISTFLPDYNAMQVGAFSDQACINKRPNWSYLFTSVTDA